MTAASVYLVAAWMVAPGFYDGINPITPYNWVCPPAIAGANTGVKPLPGHLVIKVINGTSDANTAFTQEGQMSVSFLPGAFQAAGGTMVLDQLCGVDVKSRLGTRSALYPDSESVIGWDIGGSGFRIVLTAAVSDTIDANIDFDVRGYTPPPAEMSTGS